MANEIFKCKICGGTLEITSGETVATCEYCGTQQTLPKLDDERRTNLYDRANHFRRNNEFDKAMKYLEEALAVEKEPAEREKLYVRIGLISFQTKKYDAAAAAAKEIKNINPENGYAYFILGQCYATSANCAEIKCQACYWAAYDMMSQAVSLLTNEPNIQESAQKMMQSFRSAFQRSW